VLAAKIVGRVDHGLDPQRPPFLEVLLDAGVAVEDVDGDLDAAGDDLGGEAAGVSLRMRRPKMSLTSSGRPRSRLSATRASKNARARRGWSSTRVRETSIWRMDSSHQ
jgi:hypothetical protein